MKKFWSVFMFAALVMAGFTLASCSDDDDDAPRQLSIAQQYEGSYTAIDSINVSGSSDPAWAAKTDKAATYKITATSDTTIDVTVPDESYNGIFWVNDISMGSYTIHNVAWNADSLCFYKKYGETAAAEGTSLPHFTSTGMHVNDHTYSFGVNSNIKVWKSTDGKLNIINTFMPGTMPMPIYVIFSGTKE